MCNDSQNSCTKTVVGATVFGMAIGAVSVALLNSTVREELQQTLADTTKHLNEKLSELQKSLNETATDLKEKSKDALIAELKETQKRLKAAEKKLS